MLPEQVKFSVQKLSDFDRIYYFMLKHLGKNDTGTTAIS